MPAYVNSMKNVLESFMDVQLDEDIDIGIPDFIVASNREKIFGAAAMLYSGFAGMLGEKGIVDCYVIPSSVHECLMVHDYEGTKKEDIEEMVREVNASSFVSDTDFLSNKVYRYSEIKKGFDEAVAREMSNYMAENKGVKGDIEEIKAQMPDEFYIDTEQKNMKK